MVKVFLSSTGRDLIEHREAVFRAIRRIPDYVCVRMEDFGARSQSPLMVCMKEVSQCDVLIGIIGHYHGGSPSDDGKSFTELEYEAASNIDRLMFLAPDSFSVSAELREPDDKWKRQKRFRERVRIERTVDRFSSPDDLATLVLAALNNWEREQTKISVDLAPGAYTLIVKSPHAIETRKIEIARSGSTYLVPNQGERHVLWAVFVPDSKPVPTILDFRNGKLPKEVRFTRYSSANYRPRIGDPWKSAKAHEPRFEEVVSGEIGLVLEGIGTNFFPHSSKPESRTLRLSPANYTLWMEGAGQIATSGGAEILVRQGAPKSFRLDRNCDLVFAISGEVARVQLEQGDYPTSYIETTDIAISRSGEGVMPPVDSTHK